MCFLSLCVVLKDLEQFQLAGAAAALARKTAVLRLAVHRREVALFPSCCCFSRSKTIGEAVFAGFSLILQLCVVNYECSVGAFEMGEMGTPGTFDALIPLFAVGKFCTELHSCLCWSYLNFLHLTSL